LRIDVDVFGKKEDALRSGWIKFNDLSTYPMQYSTDIKQAREVLAKAVSENAERCVKHLADITGDYIYWDGCEGNMDPEGVAHLLLATPRQISEAAYLTLKG